MKITPTYMSTRKRGEYWGEGGEGQLNKWDHQLQFWKGGKPYKEISEITGCFEYRKCISWKKTLQTIARIGEWVFVSISWNKRRTIWKWLRLVVHWAGGYVFEGSFTEAAGRHSLFRERFGNDANHCLSVLVYIPHFKLQFYFLSSAFSTWICSWSFAHYL